MRTISKTSNYLFVIIFFIFSMFGAYAQQKSTSSYNSSKQENKKEIFAFGPKIAVNFTNLSRSGTDFFSPGAEMGLFFRLSISRFYMQPEINYVIRNIKYLLISFQGPHFISKYQSHHIDIPLFFGIKAFNSKLFNLRFFVGPEFCMELKDNTNDHHAYQLGIQPGLGLDFWRFTIDASYSYLHHVGKKSMTNNHIFKVGIGFKCF